MTDLADDLALNVRNAIAYIKELEAELARCKQVCAATAEAWREEAALTEPVQEPVAKVELMMTGGSAGLATRIVEIDDHLRERLRPGQLLYAAPPQRPAEVVQEPVGYLPAYELDRLQSGHDGRLRSAKFGASVLDGDVAVYTAPPQRPAEVVQEPVAWSFEARHIDTAFGPAVSIRHPGREHKYMQNVMPLYTAPPQRKPLSAIDLRALYDRHAAYQEEGPEASGWWDFARAIERAHGITS